MLTAEARHHTVTGVKTQKVLHVGKSPRLMHSMCTEQENVTCRYSHSVMRVHSRSKMGTIQLQQRLERIAKTQVAQAVNMWLLLAWSNSNSNCNSNSNRSSNRNSNHNSNNSAVSASRVSRTRGLTL